jgi:hypothetical protein
MSLTIREQLAPTWWKLNPEDVASPEFYIRPLTSLEFIDVQNEADSNRRGSIKLSSAGIRSALAAVTDWRNVLDDAGQLLPCTSSNKERLPTLVLQVLTGQILKVTVLTDDAKKN